MTDDGYRLRVATDADIPAIRAMQARSMRELGRAFYRPAAIAAMLEAVGTMDDAVVREGHYLVAVGAAGAVVGSGGWSRLPPGYASALGGEAAARDRATVRSVFVDPGAARRGIASAIMARTEAEAAACGVRELGLTATLSGVPLYARLGYRPLERLAVDLGRGRRFEIVKMHKRLSPRGAVAA
jgi:GNAT superfamily N-acetyltransferase